MNSADAVGAIQATTPVTVAAAAGMATGDGVAVEATIDDVRLSIPTDAADGIELGEKIQIGLPFAAQAGDATASSIAGVVVYDNHNGSSTVPVITEDGILQIHTVIANADAPQRYDYPIDPPAGASLVQSPDGVVAVVTANGAPLTVFGDAWAKDANGDPVPTHYEVNGNTLTQVVETTEKTAFPVVADPSTGVYSYNCVLQNGSSYFLQPGTALNTCKGSYLQKYINGTKVQTIALTGYGTPANPQAFGTPECYIAIGVGVATVYGPGWLVRFLSGAIGYVASQGLPNITACRG
ncbi:hypothetical protein [Leifsonia shinshuensis]|uniref:hypothetical protein n=1 Tax=Leifsonia shinshuensis TaxID=150026 RepID=UPI001F50C6E9|nr:hypothetical protein [Leifsonia shinshuensis]